MNYWLDLFTGTTWDEFKKAGAKVSGFRPRMRKTVASVKPGDVLLCYLTGVKRWVGALEVIGPSNDKSSIWSISEFPERLNVRPIVLLTPETGVPMDELEGHVEFYQKPKDRGGFKGFLRGSPKLFKQAQGGQYIIKLLKDAQVNPIIRPVDQLKLARKPFFKAEIQKGKKNIQALVSVPDSDEIVGELIEEVKIEGKTSSEHTATQYLLLTLGYEMGFDVWVARNDRGKNHNGKILGQLPGSVNELPKHFNEATNKTIELIDVLWLKGNTIIAAFEVECTTLIYSGLLRMSDLLALQPNLNINLYIVAPDERRDKVEQEICRPTFMLRERPLAETCGLLTISELTEKIEGIRRLGLISSLKPDFLEQIAIHFKNDD